MEMSFCCRDSSATKYPQTASLLSSFNTEGLNKRLEIDKSNSILYKLPEEKQYTDAPSLELWHGILNTSVKD